MNPQSNQKIIIGFVGYPGSGKTAAAEFLRDHYRFHIAHIHNRVLDTAKKLCEEQKEETSIEEVAHKVRYHGAKITPNYWINLTLMEAAKESSRIVIDDLSAWEAPTQLIKVYQINRPGVKESTLENVEIINNTGTLEDFYESLKKLPEIRILET